MDGPNVYGQHVTELELIFMSSDAFSMTSLHFSTGSFPFLHIAKVIAQKYINLTVSVVPCIECLQPFREYFV